MSLELDTKEFLVQYGLMWPTEHQRIACIFTNAGALVFHVECACPNIWRVSVLRSRRFVAEEACRLRVRNLLFHHALIRLRREEPFIVTKGNRLQFSFIHQAGEEGVRAIFHKISRDGKILQCLERVNLSGCGASMDYVQRIAA